MDIIPVIDLMGGTVVRGVGGERHRYAPIASPLCQGRSDPPTVAGALQATTAADRLYVADLDAILGRAVQFDALASIARALRPGTTLWLDAGFIDRAAADQALAHLGPDVVPVFGSESLATPTALQEAFAGAAPGILSLDRRGGQPLDPSGCWQAPQHWPATVIAMALERVGSNAGPDVDLIAMLRDRARPGTALVGAGGIRDAADVDAAASSGATAWLVASALHADRLRRH